MLAKSLHPEPEFKHEIIKKTKNELIFVLYFIKFFASFMCGQPILHV